MGIILSYFRKKISTKDKLSKIQEEIASLEEYKDFTERRRKKLVGSLIAVSILFYFIAGIIVYFYYLPSTWEERLLYATPFAGFILIIYVLKIILTCYYRWKMRRNERKLALLKEKKEDMLDQVMETETYKVAKDILETFAPEQIRKASLTIKSPVLTPVVGGHRMPMAQGSELRKRIISPRPVQSSGTRQNSPSFSYVRPTITPRHQQSVIRPNHSTSSHSSMYGGPPRHYYPSSPPMNSRLINNSETGMQNIDEPPGPPMPRPILPRERGVLDRFVEYLVGDGPSNRYALVCRQCESHNGMALKDEFPYIAFRCAYCHYWNPARKQKPAPPPLESRAPRRSVQLTRRLLEKGAAENDRDSETTEEEDENDSDSGSSSSSCPSSEQSGDEGKEMNIANSSHPSSPQRRDKGLKNEAEPSTVSQSPEELPNIEPKSDFDSQSPTNSGTGTLSKNECLASGTETDFAFNNSEVIDYVDSPFSDRVEPVVPSRLEPVPAERIESLPADRIELLPPERREPLPVEKVEPLPADRLEPLPTEGIEPLPADRLEPLSTEGREPLPAERVELLPEKR